MSADVADFRRCLQAEVSACADVWRIICAIRGNISLEQLAERYPRLKPRLGSAACNEASAQDDPTALLFIRSQE